MFEHFSEDEIDRLGEFSEKPSYKRDPEQLLPDDASDNGEADDEPEREASVDDPRQTE